MATAKNDLLCYKGEAIKFAFGMKPAENISGWNITLTVKARATDAVARFASSATIDDPAQGLFSFSLLTSDTNIPAGIYFYDIWRTDAGAEMVLSIGSFIIQQDVRL